MSKPVLWHVPISHYSEKARWALAFKGIEHERAAARRASTDFSYAQASRHSVHGERPAAS